MPTFPSNSAVDSLDRLRTVNDLQRTFLSPNLLTNPGFQHIGWGGATNFDFSQNPEWDPRWLRFAPGWFPFGITSGSGKEVTFSLASPSSSPLRTESGIRWQQELDGWAGLVQELPNAKLIRGRRVRISGIFELLDAIPDSAAGVSIWLKGQKKQVAIGTGAWVSNGTSLGYDSILASSQDKAVISILPGNGPTAWGTAHPVNIPCYDGLWYDGGPSYYVRMWGGESASEAGSATRHTATAYYLTNQFSGVPATDGSFELYTEFGLAQGVHYFETFVNIPDTADLFEDEVCHLVVMSVPPADIGGMGSAVDYILHAVTLEVVLDAANVEDRVLHGMLTHQASPLPFGDASGRMDQDYLLRNPIYVPQLWPMLQGPGLTQIAPAGGAITANPSTEGFNVVSSTFDPEVGIQRRFNFTGVGAYVCSSPVLPPGSSIVGGQVSMELEASPNTGGYGDVRLYSVPAYRPTGETFSWTDNGKTVLNLVSVNVTGVGVTANHKVRARRNRVGLYWNEDSVGGDSSLALGTVGAAEHLFYCANVASNDQVQVAGAWLIVAADPRLAHAGFSQEA